MSELVRYEAARRALAEAVAVDEVKLGSVDAALIAAAKERFEQPIIQWIVAFLASFNHRLRAIS